MVAGASILDELEIETMSARFAEDGVVWTPPLLSFDEVADVRSNIGRYIGRFVSTLPDRLIRFEQDGISIRSLYFMNDLDDYFHDFGNSQRFKELVSKVAGYEMQLFCVETFNKEARVGSPTPPHQDSAFLVGQPEEIVSLWLALDRASNANGAVRYWRGSHRNGLLPHIEHHYGLQADPSFVDYEADLLVRITEPGAAAMHCGLVLHDSPANITQHPRLAINCMYSGAAGPCGRAGRAG
jgi:phytanoyl-CoA hydroxylase